MSKATLSLIVVGGLIFIFLVAGVTLYRIKFKNMEEAWINEKTQRENLEKTLAATQQQLSAKTNEASVLRDALDTLKEEVSNLSQKVTKIEAEKEKKEEEFKELQDSLQREIEAKEITITQLKGKLTVNLMDKILFDSGKAVIKSDGKRVLDKISRLLLNKYPDRQIRVEGHTDNVPIIGALQSRFPTNWELSAARAIAAVRYLQEKNGVDPTRLAAVGFGQYHPIDTNDTSEGKARNRRIEIVLLPPEPEIRQGTVER
ncbi:TPA: chemotaxis protein MotB [Candidatus Poribacteria bacterium]|nr:chemotaxis protein MotB [Candidatus Poribacteria bacterium]